MTVTLLHEFCNPCDVVAGGVGHLLPAGSVRLAAPPREQPTSGAQRAAGAQGDLQPIRRQDVSSAHAQCGLPGCLPSSSSQLVFAQLLGVDRSSAVNI